MREVTYLIYIIFWESMVFGGIGFAVFVLDRSGWWLLVAATLSMMAYSPASWIHGVNSKPPKPEDQLAAGDQT